MTTAPGFDEVIEDLKMLRRQGLVRLRSMRLGALEAISSSRGEDPGPERTALSRPSAVEHLLRSAVEALGAGTLGEAAAYTFGLTQGTRDWHPQDRRRRAAEVYGVSVERFRKHQERIVLEQVAEQLLRSPAWVVSAAPTARTSDAGSAELPVGRSAADSTKPGAAEPAAVSKVSLGARIDLACLLGPAAVPITVHVVSAELLTDIDILVSTANIHLELSRTFAPTLAGRLRSAAALRGPTGRIVDDVIDRQVRAWLDVHGGPGTTVLPGTVVPTGSGVLADQGIQRIYHAAVAVPRPGSNEYHVAPEAVVRAVREVFAIARRERVELGIPVSSLCFPLIGAGRGGMPAEASAEALWWAVRTELARDPDWRVHLVTRRRERASMLVAHLLANGAVHAGKQHAGSGEAIP